VKMRRPFGMRRRVGALGPVTGDVDRLCEEILLSSGLVDEAYERYGLQSSGDLVIKSG
jgi:hypothetical protein